MSPFWILIYGAKDDEGTGDNWSYKTRKAPVKSSPPTNQPTPIFQQGGCSLAKSTVSEHCTKLERELLNKISVTL